MNLDLTKEQIDFLQKMLENSVGELRTEVRHTDDSEFKQFLKHNEQLLREIIETLRSKQA